MRRKNIKLTLSISLILFLIIVSMWIGNNNNPQIIKQPPIKSNTQHSNSIITKDVSLKTIKTMATATPIEPPSYSLSFLGIPITYTRIFGRTSITLWDNNYVYIFLTGYDKIYGLKYDYFGNLVWSKEYDLSQTNVKPWPMRLIGKLDEDNNRIILLFEDSTGLDHVMIINRESGEVVDSALKTIVDRPETQHGDVWTFNINGTLIQTYGRSFNIDLSDYTLVTINYPYVAKLKNGMYFIFNSQNKVTNGGYDYQVIIVDPQTGLVRKSYFFGSINNDYLIQNASFISGLHTNSSGITGVPHLDKTYLDVNPGPIIDDNYIYIIVKDGIRPFIGFDIIKFSRDDGNIVWMKRYILPDLISFNGQLPKGVLNWPDSYGYNFRALTPVGQFTNIELIQVKDLGELIEIKLRMDNVLLSNKFAPNTNQPLLDTMRSVYMIIKVNKTNGKIPYSSDPSDFYNHGAIAIFERSSKLGYSYITDVEITPENRIFITAITKLQLSKKIRSYTFSTDGYTYGTFDGKETVCNYINIKTENTYNQFLDQRDCSYYKFYQLTSKDYLSFPINIKKLYANDDMNSRGMIVIQDIKVNPVFGG